MTGKKTSFRASAHLLALVGSAAVILALSPPAAVAETNTGNGVLAEYNGRTIDLSEGWQGATSCVEQADGGFRCYDDEEDYLEEQGLDAPGAEAGTIAGDGCERRYLCLWDDRYYAGKKVRFVKAGRHDLSSVGFGNRANSFYNNRTLPSELYDVGCGCTLHAAGRQPRSELSLIEKPNGVGTWNNAIDDVILHND
ncbi:peptidase inhibitor family I36 protein [Streptomyces sp. WMMC500]|uniref:peptidase inhibitor family I36 protein n=1 Tax=Streptomyces sp. WMMC500 TaxID=3015154 RepID=UPI00248B4481|nr:peptidase inhibitor family I36 protein [Streptomyces sp. WMMC500]WBB62377.1 peptidase inhibitor family I36 protein [Streptomyces sp. WMMC500]